VKKITFSEVKPGYALARYNGYWHLQYHGTVICMCKDMLPLLNLIAK